MKVIQICVTIVLALAPISALASFEDNNGPDQVDKYLGRVSRFGSDENTNKPKEETAPSAIDSASFAPSELGSAAVQATGRSPASEKATGTSAATAANNGAANDGEIPVKRGNPRGLATLDPKKEASEKAKEPEGLSLSEIQKRGGVQEVAIISNDLGFFPANIVLTKGIPARLFLSSTGKTQGQCFMLDEFKIRRQIKHDKIEEIQINPETECRYTFHCPMNGARGTILVKSTR